MKRTTFLVFAAALIIAGIGQSSAQDSSGQDSTGLPGDQFSLQGALELFRRAGSPEEFEKLLNTQESHVNNLDLNGDGDIDYVRVIDKMEKGVHAFVLQVPVSATENQDIAVIELEKTGDTTAILQIIGDEDIFGKHTIVEPDGGGDIEEEGEEKEEDSGPHFEANGFDWYSPVRVVVNVWSWPAVRYVYGPAYRVWVSPWRWRAYPMWWHPWHPLAWRAFHPFRMGYRTGFAVVRTHRIVGARRFYAPVRASSVTVRTRNHAAVGRYRAARTTRVRTRPGGTKVRRTTTRVRTKR